MEQTEIARGRSSGCIHFGRAGMGRKSPKGFHGLCRCICVWCLGAFPLYFHNYYYDILVSKYQFYWLSTVAMRRHA